MHNSSIAMIVGRVHRPLEVKDVTVDGEKKRVGNMTVCVGKQTPYPTYYQIIQSDATRREELAVLNNGDAVIALGRFEAYYRQRDGNNGIVLTLDDARVNALGAGTGEDVQKIVAIGRATGDVVPQQTGSEKPHATIIMELDNATANTPRIEAELCGDFAESMSTSIKKGCLLSVSGEIELCNNTKNDGKSDMRLIIAHPSIAVLHSSATARKANGRATSASRSSGKGMAR